MNFFWMNIIPVTKPTRFPRRYFSLSTRWCFFKIWKKIKSQPKRQTLPLCHREAKVPRVRPKEQHIRVDQNGTYRVGLGKEEWETIDGYTKLWTYKSERKICKTLSQIYDDKQSREVGRKLAFCFLSPYVLFPKTIMCHMAKGINFSDVWSICVFSFYWGKIIILLLK